MKKIVTSLITTVGILGSTILFTGCVQLPPVPDAMKVSTYTTGSSNDRYTNVANCKNRSKPDTNVGVRPDAKTEFNRTVKRS